MTEQQRGRCRLLGLCNRCTFNNMQRRAKERGAFLDTKPGEGDWEGWTLVYASDKDEPQAYFMKLTEECAC